MKTLIYLEDAIDAICKKCKADYPDTSACDICDDISVLKSLPSAEPEIIRCRYCKHNTSKPNAGNASCELFYGMSDQFGFCHRAERRTDE